MRYLLDTGILLRFVHSDDPLHGDVRRAIRALKERGHATVTTTQSIGEFWNVCTRPMAARGGLGLSIEKTSARLNLVERMAEVLPDAAGTYAAWKALLVSHRVSGVQVHDARIVAAMRVHGVRHLLTLNKSDFARYAAITAVAPGEVAVLP